MKVVLREKQKPRSPTNVVLATFKGFLQNVYMGKIFLITVKQTY